MAQSWVLECFPDDDRLQNSQCRYDANQPRTGAGRSPPHRTIAPVLRPGPSRRNVSARDPVKISKTRTTLRPSIVASVSPSSQGARDPLTPVREGGNARRRRVRISRAESDFPLDGTNQADRSCGWSPTSGPTVQASRAVTGLAEVAGGKSGGLYEIASHPRLVHADTIGETDLPEWERIVRMPARSPARC